MKSIPVLPREHYAEGVYGLTWRQVFRIRNTIAWHWFYRFGEQIPFEEFASEANQGFQALLEVNLRLATTGYLSNGYNGP